jgi:uridine kinase
VRHDVLQEVARAVPVRGQTYVRVGIDGTDGSGKTCLADELAGDLRSLGRDVVRASIDDFHHIRATRYRRGRSSAEGFYRDSFDLDRFRTFVLDPFGPAGDGRYCLRGHDLATDQVLEPEWRTATPGTVLVVDGVFLHREGLSEAWDLSVWLDVSSTVTCARMAIRDGTDPDPGHPSVRRYVEGQRLYVAERRPADRATLVVDNSDLDRPVILGRGS